MVRWLVSVPVLVIAALVSTAAVPRENHIVLGGDEDAEVLLFHPSQVEEGPDGNIYVLDAGDSFIKAYSPAGEFLKQIGGAGEGPGEFQRVDGATFGFTHDGNLYFTEYVGGHRWITVMDLEGNLNSVVTLQIDRLFGIIAARSLPDGGFLVLVGYDSVSRAQKDHYLYDTPRSLVRTDNSGTVVAEIVSTESTRLISFVPNGATVNLPFTPVLAWATAGSDRVVWSDGLDNRFTVLDHGGRVVGEIATGLPEPVPVMNEDLEEWRSQREEYLSSRNPSWWQRFGRVIYEYRTPLYDKPILVDITAAPQGRWLVEGARQSSAHDRAVWLLDRDGVVVASAATEAWGVRLSSRYLLFLGYDEDDLPLVHVYERESEAADALSVLELH